MAFLTTFHPSTLEESSAQRIQLMPGRDAVRLDIAAVRARRLRVSGLVLDSHGSACGRRRTGLSAAPETSPGPRTAFTSNAAGSSWSRLSSPGSPRFVVGGGGRRVSTP